MEITILVGGPLAASLVYAGSDSFSPWGVIGEGLMDLVMGYLRSGWALVSE